MALLPYSVRQVTQRSRGGRRDRDRGDRGDRSDRDRMPEPPPKREAAAGADNGGASVPTEGGNGADAASEVAVDTTAPAPAGGEDQS